MATECFVHIQLPGTTASVPCGRFVVVGDGPTPGIGRFVYGRTYRERPEAVPLDPYNLPLTDRPVETTDFGGIFGALRDASPDAWGRRLIAARLGRPDLTEVDYLLHAGPEHVGALCFGPSTAPPKLVRFFDELVELPELLSAADTFVERSSTPEAREEALTRLLQAKGSTVGGTGPKSVVRDRRWIYIAKFPNPLVPWDAVAVEAGLLRLARHCDITTPDVVVHETDGQHVLLVNRFDRELSPDGRGGFLRHRVLSAASVLRADLNPAHRSRWSYLLLADELQRYSADPRKDKVDLFRRMVFNALVSNTDDHPRNHALVARGTEFRLAPAYDLTPTPRAPGQDVHLAMRCGPAGTIACRQNIVASSGTFGLSFDEANAIIDTMQATVAGEWERDVRYHGATTADVAAIAPAFGNPAFEYPADDAIKPPVPRRRRTM